MKTLTFLIISMTLCSLAFAGGKVTKKDKEYGNCLVNSPKVCGGYSSSMTADEYKAFKDCTANENKKCYDSYMR